MTDLFRIVRIARIEFSQYIVVFKTKKKKFRDGNQFWCQLLSNIDGGTKNNKQQLRANM